MISGVHSIIYSNNAEADRAFLRDILKLTNVDVGGGWLIFGLPPSEVAVHPSNENNQHELYLMCDDINAFVAAMGSNNIVCAEINDQGWGLLTQLTLPGGGRLGVYEPRHARPEAMKAKGKSRKKTKKASPKKKAVKKEKKVKKPSQKKKAEKKKRK